MNIRRQLLRTCLAWGLLGIFLVSLNPAGLPVVVLIVPFLLLFAALYCLWGLARRLRAAYFSYGDTHQGHLGAVVCATLVLLLVLQSLGQLTPRDIITVGAIIGLGYVYMSRAGLSLPRR